MNTEVDWINIKIYRFRLPNVLRSLIKGSDLRDTLLQSGKISIVNSFGLDNIDERFDNFHAKEAAIERLKTTHIFGSYKDYTSNFKHDLDYLFCNYKQSAIGNVNTSPQPKQSTKDEIMALAGLAANSKLTRANHCNAANNTYSIYSGDYGSPHECLYHQCLNFLSNRNNCNNSDAKNPNGRNCNHFNHKNGSNAINCTCNNNNASNSNHSEKLNIDFPVFFSKRTQCNLWQSIRHLQVCNFCFCFFCCVLFFAVFCFVSASIRYFPSCLSPLLLVYFGLICCLLGCLGLCSI